MNVLFLCSMAVARSPTAVDMFRRVPGLSCRCAGVDPDAHYHVRQVDIDWADVIVCMEEKHAKALHKVRQVPADKQPEVLNIPDRFKRNDPALQVLLRESLSDTLAPYLQAAEQPEA